MLGDRGIVVTTTDTGGRRDYNPMLRSPKRPFVVTFASGKGGAGKTLMATNFAHYLARDREITLLDCDVEEPNCALFLKGEVLERTVVTVATPSHVEERCLMCGECARRCRFNAVLKVGERIHLFPKLCHSCAYCSDLCPVHALPMVPREIGVLQRSQVGRLTLLEGRLNLGEEKGVGVIERVLKEGCAPQDGPLPDLVLVDAPPGTACPAQAAVAAADLLICVTEPTPYGGHDRELLLALAKELGVPAIPLLNRVPTHLTQEFEEGTLLVPHDLEIATSYATGRLAYENNLPLLGALDLLKGAVFHVP